MFFLNSVIILSFFSNYLDQIHKSFSNIRCYNLFINFYCKNARYQRHDYAYTYARIFAICSFGTFNLKISTATAIKFDGHNLHH